MIHEVEGDILLSSANTIAHGVAPGDHFEQGLALALRERWPAMVKDFRHHCHVSHPEPGELWSWPMPDGRRIVNLLTQPAASGAHSHGHPGRAHVEHVNAALRALHRFVTDEKVASLALPRLATGVGGLAWTDVQPLVTKHLGELKIPVYIYTTYRQGVKASEPTR